MMLKDKVAVICGASGGVVTTVVHAFTREGR
jgi:NAD(P)-dependent dehydrogenase (short-subunit alcohol dehydrogenase family)